MYTTETARETQYTYHALNRLEKVTDALNGETESDFGSDGRLSSVKAEHLPEFTRQAIVYDIEYKPFGPLKSLTFGSGETRTKNWDSDYLLTELKSGNLLLHTYADDANGIITDITDELASLDRSYAYNKLDQLKAHTGPDGISSTRTLKHSASEFIAMLSLSCSAHLTVISGFLQLFLANFGIYQNGRKVPVAGANLDFQSDEFFFTSLEPNRQNNLRILRRRNFVIAGRKIQMKETFRYCSSYWLTINP